MGNLFCSQHGPSHTLLITAGTRQRNQSAIADLDKTKVSPPVAELTLLCIGFNKLCSRHHLVPWWMPGSILSSHGAKVERFFSGTGSHGWITRNGLSSFGFFGGGAIVTGAFLGWTFSGSGL
jgi:hypothetical protein